MLFVTVAPRWQASFVTYQLSRNRACQKQRRQPLGLDSVALQHHAVTKTKSDVDLFTILAANNCLHDGLSIAIPIRGHLCQCRDDENGGEAASPQTPMVHETHSVALEDERTFVASSATNFNPPSCHYANPPVSPPHTNANNPTALPI